MRKIFIDLDGVLADFDAHMFNQLGKHISEISTKEMWAFVRKYENDGGEWFYDLPLTHGAHVLFKTCNKYADTFILTATGNDFLKHSMQKRRWVKKHFGLTYDKIITVPRGAYKGMYAEHDCLLIDDTETPVKSFLEAGGKAIMHTSVDDTLTKLLNYF